MTTKIYRKANLKYFTDGGATYGRKAKKYANTTDIQWTVVVGWFL